MLSNSSEKDRDQSKAGVGKRYKLPNSSYSALDHFKKLQ